MGLLVESQDQGPDLRPEVFRLCKDRGWVLMGMASKGGSLEDVFAKLTVREEHEARASEGGEKGGMD